MTGNIKDTFTGSASQKPDSATDEQVSLTKCAKPLGVAALVEPEASNTLYASLAKHNLPNPLPMLKLMMSQSNCFRVADRGAGSKALERERALASAGELSSTKNTKKGQMVSADWVITPNIIFQDSNAGDGSIALGGLVPFGALLGSVKVNNIEAQTLLTAVSVQTGLQDAVAEGTAKKKDLTFGGGGIGAGFIGGGGAYASTDVGKIVTFAFMDAHNKLVVALKNSEQL